MRYVLSELCNTDHLRYARLWTWLGVFLIVCVVVLSLIDPPQSVKAFLLQDKMVHAIVYAGLMGWFAQIFRQHSVRLLLVGVFIGIGVGVEYLQALVPSRHFDLLDMLANTFGVVLAWALAYTWMGQIFVWFERTFLPQVSYSQ